MLKILAIIGLLYAGAQLPEGAIFKKINDNFPIACKDMVLKGGTKVLVSDLSEHVDSLFNIQVPDGDQHFNVCGKVVINGSGDAKLMILDVDWQTLRPLFREWYGPNKKDIPYLESLAKKFIEIPKDMNRHSPYAICTWIRVSEDLQKADCRRLEGDEFAIWNSMFNKNMEDLPKVNCNELDHHLGSFFKVRIFAPTCTENRLHFDAIMKVIGPGEFEFVSGKLSNNIELLKRDCKMLATACTDQARARARKRLKLALDKREKISTTLSTNEFENQFEIDCSKCSGSTKPVPDFLETSKIKELYMRSRMQNNPIFRIKDFIFDLAQEDSDKDIDINEFESEQEDNETETDEWPDVLFCAIFPEGRLYLRFVDEGDQLEVLNPNNGNLDKLKEFYASGEKTLDPSGFWAVCPEDFEEAKKYLLPNTDSSSPNEFEEECPEK